MKGLVINTRHLRFQFHKGTIRTRITHINHTNIQHFNSIKVQLELYIYSMVNRSNINFNSIKVQLEQINIFHTIAFLRYFNSIKVQLERRYASTILPKLGYFNSIKVQLEQNNDCVAYVSPIFQFHKGTIRTR